MRFRCSGVVSISFSGVSRPSGLLLFLLGAVGRLAKPLGGTEECHPSRLGRTSVSVMSALSRPVSSRIRRVRVDPATVHSSSGQEEQTYGRHQDMGADPLRTC